MHLFDTTGAANTEKTLELSAAAATALDIDTILVATTSGKTGLQAVQRFTGRKVVVITHSTGFAKAGMQQIDPELLEQIKQLGARVLTTTHAFGGVGRAVRRKFQTYQVDEIMAQTLRIFGQGTKVAVELAVMAADAGLAPVDRDVIAIGGTGSGADTAVVLQPAHAQDLFELKIRQLICKPYL